MVKWGHVTKYPKQKTAYHNISTSGGKIEYNLAGIQETRVILVYLYIHHLSCCIDRVSDKGNPRKEVILALS